MLTLRRDEAFELGCQWATLYPESSPSRNIINEFMNTSYLVNIVANDFKDGSYIFDPFLLDQAQSPTATKSHINGNGINGNGTNGIAATATEVVGEALNGAKETVSGLAQGVKNVVNGHGTAEGVAINGH